MKKYYIIYLLMLATVFCVAQNDSENKFMKDSLHYNKYVKAFINELEDEGIIDIIRLSDYNFVSNDTYIFWKTNNQLFSRLISKKKLKKRIKNKKIRLSKNDKKSILKLFDLKYDYTFLKEYESCKSEFSHHYKINLYIHDNKYDINSSCAPSIKNNELVGVLFKIVNDINNR